MHRGEIAVIGAGIVGASIALSLAIDGWKVTIFEPNDPGSGCSMGNAGLIGTAAIVPWSTPHNVRNSLRMLLDAHHPLKIPISGWLENATWMARFIAASRPHCVDHGIRILNELCSRGWSELEPLVDAACARDLVNDLGTLQVFSSQRAFAQSLGYNELRRRHGHAVTELTGDQIREMEPAIGREVVAGVHLPEVKAVSHPQELVRRFMQAAIARGSQLIAHDVQAIARESGRTGVLAAGSHYRFDKVVLAGGLWSRRFFRDLDVTVPMAAERGFHFQMTGFGNLLGRPVSFIDRRVVCSPMLEGLRLTTGAVFGGAKAAPEYRLARRIFDRAKHLIPALHDFTGREWSGFRPSTPDSVPIIGVSQTMPDVIIATGHGHGGLCLSGVTGRLVTMLANGTLEPGELAPLSPNRPISPSNDMKLAMSPLRLARHSLD